MWQAAGRPEGACEPESCRSTEQLHAAVIAGEPSRVRFAKGLAPAQLDAAVQQFVDDHPEPGLLALAYGRLRDSALLGIADEAQKYLVLATFNLVECVSRSADCTVR